ncbi:MAG: FAD-dependent oxidoreductase, partial [Gordonia amarae]
MAYVITQNCCNDASCVVVCPVGCIHPRPDDPDFGTAEMLYIDAKTCIDCGACADACPVDAILPGNIVNEETAFYRTASDDFFDGYPQQPVWDRRQPLPVRADVAGLRVAIVGSGAAGWYAAKDLLRHPGVEVHMFDRVPVPGGLIRYGVAPDHPDTKSVMRQFRWGREQDQRFSMHLGVEVGADLSHDDLMRHHHAVIYAHGATTERLLDIPGEQLPQTVGALGFVGWYNGHPDNAALAPDLSGRRVVVIGNGNVALDVSRVILGDPNMLAHTDIADHALAALRDSAVEEVVILGRSDPASASFTTPELHGLSQVAGLDIIVDPADLDGVPDTPKTELLRAIAASDTTPGNKRIVLRFNVTAEQILGRDRAAGVRVRCGDRTEDIDACLVVRAVGFLGAPMPG